MGEPVIEFEGVTVAYSHRIALYDITLTIKRGEFIGVIGPNGSGKSTMLKSILGLTKPLRGKLSLFGDNCPFARSFRSRIGYLPQREVIDPRFPIIVRELVLMGRYGTIGLLHSPTKKDKEVAMQALKQVGMEDFAEEPVGHLSGGQQQRVLIARALAQEPEVLLLDEPTTGLDVAAQEKIVDIICKIHKEKGITVLFVTHDVNQISSHVDKLAYLNRRLYAFGRPEEVLRRETLTQIYGTEVTVLEGHGRPQVIVGDHHA